MRVGIVWSWYDVALVTSRLPAEIQVDCFIDWAMRPWSSKSWADVMSRIYYGVEHLISCGVDAIIVPPFAEQFCKKQFPTILPFFETYMHTVVLPASRVGKLGIMQTGTFSAKQDCKEMVTWYTPNSVQQATKVFDSKFPCREHDLSHWNLHLPYASKRSWMMRNLIKYDLRYFKDCAVDTLVPYDWWLVYREKMIRHRLWARMKFHWSTSLRAVLVQLCAGTNSWAVLPITLHTTADCAQLFANKEWKQLFDRGGKRDVATHIMRGCRDGMCP